MNKQTLSPNRCVKALLPLLIFVVLAGGHAGATEKLMFYPPPQPQGAEVATVELTPPPGNAGREIFAGLKRDGRIVARGEAVAPNQAGA